jgi:hypothetical protein
MVTMTTLYNAEMMIASKEKRGIDLDANGIAVLTWDEEGGKCGTLQEPEHLYVSVLMGPGKVGSHRALRFRKIPIC